MNNLPATNRKTSTLMADAISDIDNSFGDGFAKAHLELVIAFMQAEAVVFGATTIATAIEKVADKIHYLPEHAASWEQEAVA
jgi:hypothetical protein